MTSTTTNAGSGARSFRPSGMDSGQDWIPPQRVFVFGATSAIAMATQLQLCEQGSTHFFLVARHAERLRAIKLFPVAAIARDWDDAQQKFFAENGIIDTIYKPKPRTD